MTALRDAFLIGLVTGAVGLTSPAAVAAGECADLSPSDLKVYTLSSGVKVEYATDGTRPGRRVRGKNAESANPHPYLTVIAGVGMQLAIDGTTVARGDAYCASPRKVHIGIGLIERIVRLPAAASADACIREALLRHARLHTDTVEQVTERFVASTDEAFGQTLDVLKSVPATTAADAQQNFDRGVREVVARAAQLLRWVQRDASQAVDTDGELQGLDSSCDGRIGILSRVPAAYSE